MNEQDKAYIRDVILILKRVTRMMPDEMPKETTEFELQIRLAESQIQKLKGELGIS